jgi:hypothetical protein
VDEQRADEFLTEWYEMARAQPGGHDLYLKFKPAICRLLANDVETSGVAVVDGIPTVLAFGGARLLTAQAVAHAGKAPRVVVGCLPLEPERVAIEVIDNPTGAHPDGSPAHTLSWKFTWADGYVLAFDTVVKRQGGRDPGEAVALTLARRLGWAIPDANPYGQGRRNDVETKCGFGGRPGADTRRR